MRTVWVLPDQLTRRGAALHDAVPGEARVLIVDALPATHRPCWHRQRVWLQASAVRHFAASLEKGGFSVDLRRPEEPTAANMAFPHFAERAFREHCRTHAPREVVAEEPSSWEWRRLLLRLGVRLVPSQRSLVDYDDFRDWAAGGRRLLMDSFYRRQRRRLGYLMETDGPAGGRWSYDAENRRPAGPAFVTSPVPTSPLDAIDWECARELDPLGRLHGSPPDGLWPTTRRRALARLRHFVEHDLACFGPVQDAMLGHDWHLAHSLLSAALNLGLLDPHEVCTAVERAWRAGGVPLPSAEGFIRQIAGWRAYVWAVYWSHMPEYAEGNALDARADVPPALLGEVDTAMACLAAALDGIERRAYAHHIQRLMVLGNLALLTGVEPRAMTEWMMQSFVDGHHWVMVPNVHGMALWADGGVMATKPYVAGGRYIERMSDYCGGCVFDPHARTGPDACPFTTLYWDFLLRQDRRLASVGRLGPQLSTAGRLRDAETVRRQAADVRARLAAGSL